MLKTTFFDVLRFENEEAATEIFTVEYTEDKMKITCPGGTIEELPRRSSDMNQMHPADHKVLFGFLNKRMEELVWAKKQKDIHAETVTEWLKIKTVFM